MRNGKSDRQDWLANEILVKCIMVNHRLLKILIISSNFFCIRKLYSFSVNAIP